MDDGIHSFLDGLWVWVIAAAVVVVVVVLVSGLQL